MKKTYPLVAPSNLIELINEDLLGNYDVEDFLPGVMKGLYLLNKKVLVFPPKTFKDDEGFASWVYNFDEDDGKFYVSADQPHYLKKGMKLSWVWDGKKFK